MSLQKCLSDGHMDTDEGPLINENSNGLSHLLTDGEFSVDAAVVDESSASNQAFLNAVELSGSVGDYLDNNTVGFNTDSFDVGDNAVNFPSDSLNNVLSDGDTRLSDAFKTTSDIDLDFSETQKSEIEPASEPDFNNVIENDLMSASCEDVVKHNIMNNDITMETQDDDQKTNDIPKETNLSEVGNGQVPKMFIYLYILN